MLHAQCRKTAKSLSPLLSLCVCEIRNVFSCKARPSTVQVRHYETLHVSTAKCNQCGVVTTFTRIKCVHVTKLW